MKVCQILYIHMKCSLNHSGAASEIPTLECDVTGRWPPCENGLLLSKANQSKAEHQNKTVRLATGLIVHRSVQGKIVGTNNLLCILVGICKQMSALQHTQVV